MKSKVLLMTILAGLSQAAGWAAPEAGPQKPDLHSYDTYRIISQRNIFSRNRRPPQPMNRNDDSSQRKSVVISLYVLKGIAENGPEKIAFIENEVSGEFMQATIGTPVVNGTIKDIQHDHVVYEENGRRRQIRIGEIFSKTETQVEEPAGAAEQSPPPAQEKKEDQKSTPSDENDILKKMLERRKNQVGT